MPNQNERLDREDDWEDSQPDSDESELDRQEREHHQFLNRERGRA